LVGLAVPIEWIESQLVRNGEPYWRNTHPMRLNRAAQSQGPPVTIHARIFEIFLIVGGLFGDNTVTRCRMAVTSAVEVIRSPTANTFRIGHESSTARVSYALN
jgi:hypothetical protein